MATEGSLGRIVVPGQVESALPLEWTRVEVQMTGALAVVGVIQQFGNPLTQPAELEYLFPLPEGAAVTDFTLRVGKRAIRSTIDVIERAREAYAEARGEGRRAGLLEQRRPNLFAVQIANLKPGETVQAEIRYQERVKFNHDGFEFVFAMGLTPKYDRPGQIGEGSGVHAPVAAPREKIGAVEISLSIDTGLPCGEPGSPSHPLEVIRLDEHRLMVRMGGEQIPDRDFVLRVPVSAEVPRLSCWSSADKGGENFLAAIIPPLEAQDPLPLKREFVFVLDRSGSMGGEPIKQARNALRACLRTLNPGDTIRVLLFDDRLEWYRDEPVVVDQMTVDTVDAFLSHVEARGGTEIIAALEAALAPVEDPARVRFIVFLTDGAVSADAAALETLRRKIGPARVFTFGIGPSVNRALLARMARLGRGSAIFLQADEDIEGAIIRFQDQVSFPALTDLSLRWEGIKAWDIYPVRLPDLYYGQALELAGRFQREQPKARLILSGKRDQEVFETSLDLPSGGQYDPAVTRVWAKARVDDLLETAELDPHLVESVRSAVIGLALEHRLATPYTAFSVVDEQAGEVGGSAVRILVAQPLPQGLNFHNTAGIPPVPRMAMAAVPVSSTRPSVVRAMFAKMVGEEAENRFDQASAPALLGHRKDDCVPNPVSPERLSGEQFLRMLARTQRLDGSWDEDVERTAAGLLVFHRSGHTATAGSFRQTVRRALHWLETHPALGFAGFARKQALAETGARTGKVNPDEALTTAEIASWENELAAAALHAGDGEIATLMDLRLAGLLGRRVKVASGLQGDPAAQAWLALTEIG
jgi:Ca-activated chloride channel family protein